ncbi:polyprenol monophosphomannose synthase [Brooklawnia propionicigenes]|uniref:Polyprenol monophosphomannose synthase n=2 Tax=Brooklawnia propionicigenes TaxID=3041175 RepID=A0AAN0KFY7_9ACTN|nr:polyprenol monophosphomannose synthase [Brooklawnia sp. SH051]
MARLRSMAQRSESLDHVLVITPTYNEAENIESIIGRLRAAVPNAYCLIADDNSPDGTGAIADRMAAQDKHIHVLHRAGKEGLAAAYLAGFKWGLERGFDVIAEMDADGSHQPELLPAMLQALRDKNADMVKGSRWMRGGSTDQGRSREMLSRLANIWIQVAMDLPVHDATGGFNVFRASILRKIDLDDVASKGYTFQIDMTRRVIEAGGTVAEVPIYFPDREHGLSKMSGSIITEALISTGRWGIEKRTQQLKNVGHKLADEFESFNSRDH